MSVSQAEDTWPQGLQALLEASPVVKDLTIDSAHSAVDAGQDGEAKFRVGDEPHRLLIACKFSGQPRHVRAAISQLGPLVFRSPMLTRGMVVAPFISPASRAILTESNMGWLDLAGNARIVFPRFHLEINMSTRDPFASKREQRSLFFPKSVRLLKLLLRKPEQVWRVTDLAAEAGVSAGQVSNVRRALIEREWAHAETGGGLRLTQADALLDAWRDANTNAPNVLMRGHTLKHGRTLDTALQAAFAEAGDQNARLLLASHSVARRVAPFARVAGEFFYADAAGLSLLERHLQVAPSDKGENITVYQAEDDGLWLETMALAPTLTGTGPIQTYLDLLASGERGREAADHWRAETIQPLLHPKP